nr:hypothetical protein [Lentibacillus sp. Marseille-P4043]
MKGKYSITKILDSLGKASCSHIQGNYYLFDLFDDVLFDINKELDVDLGQKCLSLKEIKKVLGATKIG